MCQIVSINLRIWVTVIIYFCEFRPSINTRLCNVWRLHDQPNRQESHLLRKKKTGCHLKNTGHIDHVHILMNCSSCLVVIGVWCPASCSICGQSSPPDHMFGPRNFKFTYAPDYIGSLAFMPNEPIIHRKDLTSHDNDIEVIHSNF